MYTLVRFNSVFLSMLLAFQTHSAFAQQPIAIPTPRMNIVPVQGEATIHNLRDKKSVDIIIRVRDGNRNPISGASVTFALPTQGASGEFLDRSKTLVTTSDGDGYAIARSIRSNSIAGPFVIEVKATHNDQTATASVTQFNMNVESRRNGSGKWIGILAVIGAAGAGGTVYALRNGRSGAGSVPAAPTAIGLTPGASTVGPPR